MNGIGPAWPLCSVYGPCLTMRLTQTLPRLEFTSKAHKPSDLCTYVEFMYALDGDIGKGRPSLRILAPFPEGVPAVLTIKIIGRVLVAC